MAKSKESESRDRRRFFRIDDEVNLAYKLIDKHVISDNNSQTSQDLLDNYSLESSLDILNQEGQLILMRIEKSYSEIAAYLKVLNSKVDLITKAIIEQDEELRRSTMRQANISASGLSFDNEIAISKGSYLEIKLLLTSCLSVVKLYGEVVYCKQNADESPDLPYQIGVNYFNFREEEREILIKHIVKRQMQQIRELKQQQ